MATKIKVSNFSAEVNQHIAQIASEGGGIDSAQVNSIISGKLSSLNQSIIPDTNITYDLGSVTNRFRDLYLSGTTIDLAGTKISTNDSGDVRFLDGNNTPKRIVVKEIELDDPTDASFKTVISRGSGGGISFIKVNRFTGILEPTIEAVDLSSNTTADLAEGTNLYYTSIRVNSDTLAYLTANSYATQAYVNNAVEALPDSAQVRGLFSATGDLTYNSTSGQFSVTVPEGYSTVDFDSDFGTKSTSNLTEGTNLYYTTVRADSDTAAYLALNGYDTATNIIATITNAAPATLDTLNELAAALGDDPNFATTVAANIAAKLDSAEALALFSGGTGVTYNGSGQFSIGQSVATNANVTFNNISVTGTVDGRDVSADGSKLDGIEAGATADQTITAGSGLTGGGTGDVTISHADTSSQGSVNNSGAAVIQDVTLDEFGHVTGLGSATLDAATVGAVPAAGGVMSGNLRINNSSPTITFQDTDHNTGFIHVNSNLMYVLRGSNNATDWSQVNGQWPFTFNLANNDANCGGNFTAVGNVTAYSDIRLKKDLEVIADALNKVMSLTGYTYERIDTGARHTGVVAQDVQKVLPEAVQNDGEHLSVAYGNMVGLLIEAIKEQQKQINELKARLEM